MKRYFDFAGTQSRNDRIVKLLVIEFIAAEFGLAYDGSFLEGDPSGTVLPYRIFDRLLKLVLAAGNRLVFHLELLLFWRATDFFRHCQNQIAHGKVRNGAFVINGDTERSRGHWR